jgi:signal transduction histidine kinase
MKRLKLTSAKIIWAIPVATLILILLIWLNFLKLQKQDKQETISAAIERNTNLAVALEHYTIRTIHNADAILQLLKTEYLHIGTGKDIGKLLYDNAVNNDFIKGVAIIDTNGSMSKLKLQTNSSTDLNDIHVEDRLFFQFHKTHDTDIIYISKPILSRTINKPVIILSRRLNRNNKFAGVVAVQIEPSTFTSFYAQANLRTHDIISLIAPDGITYARRTGSIESNGENISKSPLFEHLKHNPDSFYFAKDAIRGIPSWFSYRKLKAFPIIATVGVAEEDILKDYFVRLQHNRNSTIIISLLIILFSFFIHLFIKNRKYYQQQIAKQAIAAQEKERELIGNELHDNVNQLLITAKLYAEMALKNKDKAVEYLSENIALISTSIAEIRNLSHRLTPPLLKTGKLADALASLLEKVGGASGLEVHFKLMTNDTTLSLDQSLALYRIAQEQLNNILKHAQASSIDVRLWQNEKNVYLSIQDNGIGFNIGAKRSGAGIANIISRVKMYNGNIEIKTAPGQGCELKIMMPVTN